MSMVKTENLRKVYGEGVVGLEGLTMTIGEGQIFGFIGPNGAGKTTTIRMLCGLLRPSGGKAWVNDIDVAGDLRGIRRHVGYMPDQFGVYEEMRVWEYLDFFGAAFKIPRRQRRERIDAVLEITRSEAMRDYFVDSLSRGMRQRIGIAKTLIHDPKVLFLDEPANGLDPRARIDMRELIKTLSSMGKTIIVSSHILPELGSICDVLGIIERGRLLAFGTLSEIMQKVRPNRIVELEFLGPAGDAMAVAEELVGQESISNPQVFDNILQFEVVGRDRKLAELLRRFVEREVEVVWFREQESDLEEAFMKITDDAAAGARVTESRGGAEAVIGPAPAGPASATEEAAEPLAVAAAGTASAAAEGGAETPAPPAETAAPEASETTRDAAADQPADESSDRAADESSDRGDR
jgi:ABC-2 type transport system ATP-binding protein